MAWLRISFWLFSMTNSTFYPTCADDGSENEYVYIRGMYVCILQMTNCSIAKLQTTNCSVAILHMINCSVAILHMTNCSVVTLYLRRCSVAILYLLWAQPCVPSPYHILQCPTFSVSSEYDLPPSFQVPPEQGSTLLSANMLQC